MVHKMSRKILVTGATGFVGSNLARELAKEKDNDIYLLLRKSSDLWRINDLLDDTKQVYADLNDPRLDKVIGEIGPDIIYHCATYGGLPTEKDFRSIIDTNVRGSINLLNSCLGCDFSLFVNLSSSSEYGPKQKPMREDDELNPVNDYGISKVAFTAYASNIGKVHKRNIVTFRLFSPFGYYEAKSRLFPSVIMDILDNKDPKVGNPDSSRDFIFIDDVVDFLKMVPSKDVAFNGEIFNLGSGEQHTVRYVVDSAIETSRKDLTPSYNSVAGRVYDASYWVADMKKTFDTFGWKPKYDVKSAMPILYKWFIDNRYKYASLNRSPDADVGGKS